MGCCTPEDNQKKVLKCALVYLVWYSMVPSWTKVSKVCVWDSFIQPHYQRCISRNGGWGNKCERWVSYTVCIFANEVQYDYTSRWLVFVIMINANLSLNRSIRRADIYKYRLIGRLFQTQMTAVYPVNTEWQGLGWLYTDTIYTLVLNIKYIARYSDLRTIFLAVIIILLVYRI